ncbi:MAG TPA: Gfo/Idh/MocA family oxidoreductase [Roseiflexaceae bacterium]|nr:Gfo/Idh/MocA family oxidoreductase [Roseiflexaceae bacterium]
MQRLRIGIVGCGEVTQIIHLPSLSDLAERFVVTALCDVSPTVLGQVGDRWRVAKRYLDYQALVAQADVDAVLVANPHAYHAEVTLAAIAAGKHVLVEKPMCLTLREADAIAEAQQRAGVSVQVGYMRRYAPAFVEACRQVKELGEIRLARVHDVIGQNGLIIERTARVVRGGDVPPDVLAAGRALEEELVREAIGEAPPALRTAYLLLLGLSTHDISAMRELLGMPRGVLYAAQRQGGRYLTAAFDYGGFVCQFETGVDSIPRFDAGLEVYGAERVLRVVYDTPYVRNLPIRLMVTEANGQGGVVERSVHPRWGDAFVEEWLAFYESATNGRPPKTSPADFRQDLELFGEMIARMRE